MNRHQGVTLQPLALRAVIKQVNRVGASVTAKARKPLHNRDEENFTRRLPEVRKDTRRNDVPGVCLG
jgi:hypothetical protein